HARVRGDDEPMETNDEKRKQTAEGPAEIREGGERALAMLGSEPVVAVGNVHGAGKVARKPCDRSDEKKWQQRCSSDHDGDVSVAWRPGIWLFRASEMRRNLCRQIACSRDDERSAAGGEGDEKRRQESTHDEISGFVPLARRAMRPRGAGRADRSSAAAVA